MADTFTFNIPAGADHSILREALKAFADHLADRIPALADAHVGHADPEDKDSTPCAVILPGRFTFEAHLGVDELAAGEGEDFALLDVGCWDGTLELRIAAKNQPQREVLEQKVTNLFMSAKRRGVLVLQTPPLVVNDQITLYAAPVAFSLMSSSWAEEMVWEKKRYSYITLAMSYPALIAETETGTIESYHSALTEDLVSASPVYEALATDEDGNLTPQ